MGNGAVAISLKLRRVSLETKLNTRLIAEVALVVVASGESIAEARQEVVNFCWPDGEMLAYRNVDAATDDEIERIVAGRLAGAASTAVVVQVSVEIAMCAAEHGLSKWLEMRSTEFHDGANIVGE